MTLSGTKLRKIANLLGDPLQASAAAHILAEAARERGVLVADLIAEALTSTPAPAPTGASTTSSSTAPSSVPSIFNTESDDIEVAFGKCINSEAYGLISEVLHETPRAWLVRAPAANRESFAEPEIWLPKSRVKRHGEDPVGRAILVLPMWLALKKRLV